VEKNLLVLDIDETLVYAAESPLSQPEDFRVASYWVYRRPYLAEFLHAVQADFDVGIWTSAGSGYAACIVERIIPQPAALKFIWASERCTRRFDPESHEQFWIKDFKKLKRLGYDLDRVLVVDDSPEKHHKNYGNLVRVLPFTGDPSDNELCNLLPYLLSLRHETQLRSLEKRNWRSVARGISQSVPKQDA
jgi:TFIIF-interacting CTD phosphatase-like protein